MGSLWSTSPSWLTFLHVQLHTFCFFTFFSSRISRSSYQPQTCHVTIAGLKQPIFLPLPLQGLFEACANMLGVYTGLQTQSLVHTRQPLVSLPTETHPHALTCSFSLCPQTHTRSHVSQQVLLFAWSQKSPTLPSVWLDNFYSSMEAQPQPNSGSFPCTAWFPLSSHCLWSLLQYICSLILLLLLDMGLTV